VPTEGTSSAVTIYGKNFGVNGPTLSLASQTLAVTSFTDSSIVFEVPAGQGYDLALYVTVSGQVSNTEAFTYEPPVVTSYSPADLLKSGGYLYPGQIVTLVGKNFGEASISLNVLTNRCAF
jgi:hypothetical protein